MKVILFDIDKTLIDTGKLVHEFIHPALTKKLNIKAEDLQKVHDNYKAGLKIYSAFNPWEFLELLAKKLNINKATAEKIFFDPKFYIKALYKNTLPILEKYQASYSLGIYSEGVEAWQRFKLEQSGLAKYFDKEITFIASNKKDLNLINKLPKNAYVIDDRLDYIDNLKVRSDLYPIWVDRKCSSDEPDAHTITSLSQLTKIIK